MKKTLCFLAVFFLFSSISFAVIIEEDAYIEAMDKYNKKDYSASMPRFQKFLDNFPNSKYRPVALLKIADMTEDYVRKKEIYERVIKENPGSEYEAEALFSLGKMYYARGNMQKCEEYMDIVAGKYPDTVYMEPVYYYSALALNAQKKWNETKKKYDEYISKGYYQYKTRMELVLGDACFSTAEYKKAAESYQKVLDSDETKEREIYRPAVYRKLAEALRKSGDEKGAEKVLDDFRYKYPDAFNSSGLKISTTPAFAADAPSAKLSPTATPSAVKVDFKKQAAVKTNNGTFTLQLGAFGSEKNAKKLEAEFKKKGIRVRIEKAGNLYRVRTGHFKTKAEAENFAKRNSIENYVIKED